MSHWEEWKLYNDTNGGVKMERDAEHQTMEVVRCRGRSIVVMLTMTRDSSSLWSLARIEVLESKMRRSLG